MEVVEEGVVPALGVSGLGVGRDLTDFPVTPTGREGRGWGVSTEGVLGGKGGNEEAGTAECSTTSDFAVDVTIFKIPGVDRLSTTLGTVTIGDDTVADAVEGNFFDTITDAGALAGSVVLVATRVEAGFALPPPRAGKSSDSILT